MVKRVVAIIVSSALLFFVGALSSPVLAQMHACDTVHERIGGFSGNIQNNGAHGSVYGVKATINPTYSTFGPCGPYDDHKLGTAAWIAVIPGPDNPEYLAGGILQIGITRCAEPNYPEEVCYPSLGSLILFWLSAGCGPIPQFGQFLGAVNDDAHSYMIRHISTGGSRYSLDFDGDYTGITKYANDNTLECWLPYQHSAHWSAETWDAADGIADSSAKLIFSDVRWRITDSGAWQDPTWNGASDCDVGYPGSNPLGQTFFLYLNCDRSNVIATQFYSWSTLK